MAYKWLLLLFLTVAVLLTSCCLADKNEYESRKFTKQKPVVKHKLSPVYKSSVHSMGEKLRPIYKAPASEKQPQEHKLPKQGEKFHKGAPKGKPFATAVKSPSDAPKQPLKHELQPMLPGREETLPVPADKPAKSKKQNSKHTSVSHAGKPQDHPKHAYSRERSRDGSKTSPTKRSPARRNHPTPFHKSPTRCRM